MGCFGRKKKKLQCTIVLLDETEIVEDFVAHTRGELVLEKVFKHLNLLETAYFGLRFLNKSGESFQAEKKKSTCRTKNKKITHDRSKRTTWEFFVFNPRWLDPLMKITKQMKGLSPLILYFGVKFYASDPCKLLEEITRYQFVLQLKQDILQGRLPLSKDLAAELFSLSLQAELGDYDPRKHYEFYVSEFRFLPNQSRDIEDKVEQLHKTLIGQVPSSVEMKFLEKVKWLDMYGMDLHPVMGDDHIEYFVGLTPSGIIVMKNKKKMSNYFWPRISKVFFKGKYFMIRVKDKTNEEMTYGFLLNSKESCEYLWRCSVEHHAFFRLTQVKDITGNPMQIFRLGSKYRYSGRTEQQIRNEMKQTKRKPPPIVRVPSRRFQKRLGQPDGADADVREKEVYKKILQYTTKDDLAIPQTNIMSPLYRSISTPAVLAAMEQQEKSQDPPPWEDPNHRGLFSSRASIASSKGHERRFGSRKRSSSIDSHTSAESRRRRHHHRSRRTSDNESEISRGSRSTRNGSHRKSRNRDSGSESDGHHRSRRRRHSSRRSNGSYHLIESESQWKMVLKQQNDQEQQASYQSAVVKDLSNRKSGYVNSGMDTESEAPPHHRKKHRRKSRSRSRSPEVTPALSQEVKQHLQYRLVDPTNLTEEEKRDIKYTKVESENNVYRIRYSPATGRSQKYKVAKVSSRTSLDTMGRRSALEDDPPPPYSTRSDKENKRRPSSSQSYLDNPHRSNHSRNSDRSRHHRHDQTKSQEDKTIVKHHRRKNEYTVPVTNRRRDISTEL